MAIQILRKHFSKFFRHSLTFEIICPLNITNHSLQKTKTFRIDIGREKKKFFHVLLLGVEKATLGPEN